MTAPKLENIVTMGWDEYKALYRCYQEARLLARAARPTGQNEAIVPRVNVERLDAAVQEFAAVDSTEADRLRKQRAEKLPHDTAEDLKGPHDGRWEF